MGALVIVATPIGNLSDISARALEALRNADLIACEDTRQTLKLLNHFGIQKPLVSYHDFNEEKKAAELGDRIRDGVDGGARFGCRDSGHFGSGLSPCSLLPRAGPRCRLSIPGPNAAVTALAASGLPCDEFFFVGFLPSKKTARREKLESLRSLAATLIFYEAPHRIQETLTDLLEILGDREACVGRELTKLHEEFLFGKLSDYPGEGEGTW